MRAFSFSGEEVGKVDSEVAGVGVVVERQQAPRTDMGWPKEEGRRVQESKSGGGSWPHRAAVVQIQGAWAPQTGFGGPVLASCWYSHQSPAATLGIRPSLLGFPLLDSGTEAGTLREAVSTSWPPPLPGLLAGPLYTK